MTNRYMKPVYAMIAKKPNFKQQQKKQQVSGSLIYTLEQKYAFRNLFYTCFCMCDWQKPKYPTWRPMADEGGIQGLGSPLCICEKTQKFYQSGIEK